MLSNATYHDLDGASIFITGGGSGIGAFLTEAFMEQGANVSFVQRSDSSEFCESLNEKFGRAPKGMQCDITDVAALKDAITKASDAHGPISVLVNNAANDDRHTSETVTEDYWDRMQAINLKAYFFACQSVIAMMREQGQGAIINFTSISYMMGNAGYPAYVTANSGINGMTRALAREFGPEKIRVNALAPGWVLTEKQRELWATPEDLAGHLERQCLKDHLQPQDIVDGVLFLSSNASGMMTGQSLVIDGGVVTTG